MWVNTIYLYVISQWFFLLYTPSAADCRILNNLDIIAALHLRRYMEERSLEKLPARVYEL